eukprot:Gb_26108 [translate_table: standard]
MGGCLWNPLRVPLVDNFNWLVRYVRCRNTFARQIGRCPQWPCPLVDDSPFLLEGQCLYLPCHWTPVYEQNFCLRFRGSRRFEGMRPFVSRFRGLGPLSLCLPCARCEYFCVGSMVLGSLLSAWSHSFCQRANLLALAYGFYDNSCPLGGIRRPPGYGWFSYKSPSLPQPGSSRYEPSHPFAS